jgi:hypothetical protein
MTRNTLSRYGDYRIIRHRCAPLRNSADSSSDSSIDRSDDPMENISFLSVRYKQEDARDLH